MLRLNGWNPRGERLVSDAPMGHWDTVTFIAGLRQTGVVAPMLIKGAMNGEAFLAYIEQCLVPTLKRRDIVVVDNVPFHKVAGVEEAIQAVGASGRREAGNRSQRRAGRTIEAAPEARQASPMS